MERTYNVPLRKEYMKVPMWRRSKKAVTALRTFLSKHMKSDNVKLSKELNEEVWKHGIRNPPHHIKVNVSKDAEGVVKADLFGKKEPSKKGKKKTGLKEKVKTETTEAVPAEEKKEEQKKA
ncbi:MAG: 60S ribosomal protein L31 [Nanoarchaeota archaeon]|nr:60S ribosomal protein L31 [Nanoarchaeota archaeon]MBU1644227.1 60S ribosomal protein L31 [Nanoarchaeota archaeon]MBU1976376.1 60S ribosomal protein L31 [Nanoarchaeota archaeon]